MPSLGFALLILAGCQADKSAPSNPLTHDLEGSAKCKDPDLDREKSLFPDGERQRLVEDLCKAILDGKIDADLGADQLHVLAFDGWQAQDLGNATPQDLVEFNAAVRGLDPVELLDDDEQPVWTTTNIVNDQFLAVGPTTDSEIRCFGADDERWCFQVMAGGASYFFLAEAKADQEALGVCPGDGLPNDCEEDVVHIDVNPDEAIFEDPDDPATFINVWSCTDFATRHARFGDGPDGFGDAGPPVPAELGDCEPPSSSMGPVKQWLWAGLKPLRWAAGVDRATAGSTGTTFARASDIAGGEEGTIRSRDILCRVSANFASISDGAECQLFEGNSASNALVASCTTVGDGFKSSQCSLLNVPVPDDDTPYFLVVDKQDQTNTAHHAESPVSLSPGDPARDEFRVCDANLSDGTLDCQANETGSLD